MPYKGIQDLYAALERKSSKPETPTKQPFRIPIQLVPMNPEIPDTVLVAWRDALKASIEQERERCAQIAEEHAHVCAEAVDALKGLKQNGSDFQIAAECASNIAKKIREGR